MSNLPDQEFAEYLAGRKTPASDVALTEDDRTALEVWALLGRLSDPQPSPGSQMRFRQWLRRQDRPQPGWIGWVAVAATLFAGGVMVGRAPWRSAPAPEVASLREEIRDLREAMIVAMLQQQSATDRLEGVLRSARLSQPDPGVLRALTDTLRQDSNVNVRLAAVDALKRFAGDQGVRRSMVESLRAADSPLVQVALIDALTELEESAARDALRDLESRVEINGLVKQRARRALEQLPQ